MVIFIFVKSLVDFDLKDQTTYPLILQRMSNLADIVQGVNFVQLYDAALPKSPLMPHKLLCLLQSYFHSCTLPSLSPTAISNVIIHNVVKITTFSQSEFVVKDILNALRSKLALKHIKYLSLNPSHTYALSFPILLPLSSIQRGLVKP